MLVNIGKTIVLDIDTTRLPSNVMDHVVYIGLRNVLMDSHANVTKEEAGDAFVEQARAVAEKKLAAMYAGNVRTGATTRAPKDALGAIIYRLARARTIASIVKTSPTFKVANVKSDAQKAWLKGKVESYSAKHADELRADAQRELDDIAARVDDIGADDMPTE